jgi:hypothetical protein
MAFSQMQKIFSPNPYDEYFFGDHSLISNDTIFSISLKGEAPINSVVCSIFEKDNKQWENTKRYELSPRYNEHDSYNFNNGRLVLKKNVNNNDTLDIILTYNIENDWSLSIQDTIFSPEYTYDFFKLYKDWLIIIRTEIDFLEGKNIEYFHFYHFENKEWIEKNKYNYDLGTATTGGLTPRSIDINDSFAIIGNYSNNENGEKNGKVYIFENKGDHWVEHKQLFQPDPYYKSSGFGRCVSISPDNSFMAIGAGRDDTGQINNKFNGCIYI